MARLSLIFGLLSGCAMLSSGPDSAVRAYFTAVQAGDEAATRQHVATACQGRPLAKGAPGKVLFVPVQMSRLDIAVVSDDGERALVAYEYEGTATSDKVDETVNVLGAEVELKVEGMTVGTVTRSGEFQMVRESGAWKISC
ncbi:MAG: hypothetical protein KC912_24960 [Proteobacteria bacterium]|nr:hypothetical protein [Pseudomonadota bacterium]